MNRTDDFHEAALLENASVDLAESHADNFLHPRPDIEGRVLQLLASPAQIPLLMGLLRTGISALAERIAVTLRSYGPGAPAVLGFLARTSALINSEQSNELALGRGWTLKMGTEPNPNTQFWLWLLARKEKMDSQLTVDGPGGNLRTLMKAERAELNTIIQTYNQMVMQRLDDDKG